MGIIKLAPYWKSLTNTEEQQVKLLKEKDTTCCHVG